MIYLQAVLLALCGLFFVSDARAEWKLDEAASSLTFVSVKNNLIGEVHGFGKLTGTVDASGGRLSVDLNSVQTGIDIRDQRMREMLFETDSFSPDARFITNLTPDAVADLQVGHSLALDISGHLHMHGQQAQINARVQAVRINRQRILLVSSEPVLISAESFGLMQGVSALAEVAGLQAILPVVPVTFRLSFTDQTP